MSNLIHMDGDEVDLRIKLELSDEDLNKIKADEYNKGKYFIHQAYLNKLLESKEKINNCDTSRYLIKFQCHDSIELNTELFKIIMFNHFIDSLIKNNKIANKIYYNDRVFYLETLVIGA